MRKILLTSLIVIVGVMFIFTSQAGAVRFYSWGTSSMAGTFYIIGAGLCYHINKRYPEVKLTPEITAGGTENMNLSVRNKIDFAMLNTLVVMEELKKKDSKIRETVRQLYWTYHNTQLHYIVRKDSPIKSFCDIKGKKFAIGPHGSTITPINLFLLEKVCGLNPKKDLKVLYYTFADSLTGIRDNTVDMAGPGAGYPIPSVADLASTVSIRLIPLTEEQRTKARKKKPSMVKDIIPAGSYRGVDYDVPTLAIASGVVARADLPEKDVYGIMKAMYSDIKERNVFHPQMQHYTIKALVDIGATYAKEGLAFHPGVVKFLKEIGEWKPELEVK